MSERNSTEFYKLGEFLLGNEQSDPRAEVEEEDEAGGGCTTCLKRRDSHFFNKELPIPWFGHYPILWAQRHKPVELVIIVFEHTF